jgi:N utilization substance protein B
MKNRSELREKIMTILYQINVYEKNNINLDLNKAIKDVHLIENEFINDVVFGVIKHKKEINELANKYLNDWTIDRLGFTDQAILQMGIYELVYTDTPDIVCIDEAVELANKYSDLEVKKMINGVLDKIYHNK